MLRTTDIQRKEVTVPQFEKHLETMHTFQDFFKLSQVVDIAESPKRKRSLDSVMDKVVEEVGELATEISIVQGRSYKEPGSDGVKGEAVDLVIASLDLLHKAGCDEHEFLELLRTKTGKWMNKINAIENLTILEASIPPRISYIKK